MNRLTAAQQAQAAKYPSVELLSETQFQQQGFDYTAAGIGASVGFVAAYALLRTLKRKNNDDFERVCAAKATINLLFNLSIARPSGEARAKVRVLLPFAK